MHEPRDDINCSLRVSAPGTDANTPRLCRRWQRPAREDLTPDSVPSPDRWNAALDAAAAKCSLHLRANHVARLAADDAIRHAALNLALEDDAW